MAIFAIRSIKNVNEDTPQNTVQDSSKLDHNTSTPVSGPTEVAAEPMIQFDDDMAHFVTHLDADPLAESGLKMHLVEDPTYNDDTSMIREIPDDNEEYTFLSFQKLSYAAVTALLPPSRTPTPSADRPTSSQSNRKSSRQQDFTASILNDMESDSENDWNANKARRGKSRAKGLAKKRGTRAA